MNSEPITWASARIRADITRPANTTAYAQFDAISGASNEHLIFNNVNKETYGKGFSIENAVLTSSANQSTKLAAKLLLFIVDISNQTDNAAINLTDTELLTRVATIDFPLANWQPGDTGSGAAGNAYCDAINLYWYIDYQVLLAENRMNLYGQLVADNAYTPVNGETFTVDLQLTRNV